MKAADFLQPEFIDRLLAAGDVIRRAAPGDKLNKLAGMAARFSEDERRALHALWLALQVGGGAS